MKNLILAVIISLNYCEKVSSQICYSYDAAGNRTQRMACSGPTGDVGGGGDSRMLLVDSSTTQNLTAIMFPNPTSGPVSIVFNNAVDNAQITVTDNVGGLLYSTSSGGSSIPLNLSNFAQGVYYIRVKTGGNTFQSSVVKN